MATFSIHAPWVRTTIKFVAALSIPLGMIWAFTAAQKGAEQGYAEMKKEMEDKPTSLGTVVNDYELKEVDDQNNIRWQLIAKKGSSKDQKHFSIEDVSVKYFDGPNVKMVVSAPLGNVDADTRYVKMMSAKGHRVEGEGDSGKSKFSAETVELDKQNQFFATGGVKIDWSEVAKVTGNEARGKIDKSGINNVKVIGHTHAVIAVK